MKILYSMVFTVSAAMSFDISAMEAVRETWKGLAQVVDLLLESGASLYFDLGAMDLNQQAMQLSEAAQKGHGQVVDLLLKSGADRTVRNKAGESAIDVAKQSQRLEIIRLLMAVKIN